ncbi:uncharacterized protein LOC106636391 [Copidosoma floridanum]|uniref:uncharacterized protein LOC106636391 n=1 Tax=Copidosoma floridanum TaxID=29053 RepID=UPI0006C95D40|nr:uncharacterized protein LOC106636391 [Copidosoma floridanum]
MLSRLCKKFKSICVLRNPLVLRNLHFQNKCNQQNKVFLRKNYFSQYLKNYMCDYNRKLSIQMDSTRLSGRKLVGIWLLTCSGMVFFAVTLGALNLGCFYLHRYNVQNVSAVYSSFYSRCNSFCNGILTSSNGYSYTTVPCTNENSSSTSIWQSLTDDNNNVVLS